MYIDSKDIKKFKNFLYTILIYRNIRTNDCKRFDNQKLNTQTKYKTY